MIQALSADFAALEEFSVAVLRDSRLPSLHPDPCQVTVVDSAEAEQLALRRLASQADWTLLIAPETEGALLQRARLVEAAGGRLLSPSPECVQITANKHATAQHFQQHGIPAPQGVFIESPADWPRQIAFPCILKDRKSTRLNSSHRT